MKALFIWKSASITFLLNYYFLIWKRQMSRRKKTPELQFATLNITADISVSTVVFTPPCRKIWNTLLIRLKHIFIVYTFLYIFQIFGRTKLFINMKYRLQTDPVLLFINWRHVYQGLHISQGFTRAQNAEHKYWVLCSPQHNCKACSTYLLLSKLISRYDKGNW